MHGFNKHREVFLLQLNGRMLDNQPINSASIAHDIFSHETSAIENVANLTLIDTVDALHFICQGVHESLVARLSIIGIQKFIADCLVAAGNFAQACNKRFVEIGLNSLTASNNGVAIWMPSCIGMQVYKVIVTIGVFNIPVRVSLQQHIQSLKSLVVQTSQSCRTCTIVKMMVLNTLFHGKGIVKSIACAYKIALHETSVGLHNVFVITQCFHVVFKSVD